MKTYSQDQNNNQMSNILNTANSMNINNPFDMSLTGMSADSNDLWNFASSSNYVWPTGFTPENQASNTGTNQSHNTQHVSSQQSQSQSNHFQMPSMGIGEPTIGHFMNTSPGTDMRLLNALEGGAAYIEGNPAEDEDIELFYYRFVSTAFLTAWSARRSRSARKLIGRSLEQRLSILGLIESRSNSRKGMVPQGRRLNLITTWIHYDPLPQQTCLMLVVYPILTYTFPYSTYSSSTCRSTFPRFPVNG